MSPFGISGLLALSLLAFLSLSWRKLGIVVALQPEVRWNQPLRRLRTVLANGLFQRRMLAGDRYAGLMHAVMFVGFLSLLVRKVHLLVIGFDETHAVGGVLGDAFTVWKDWIEIAVLAAVVDWLFYVGSAESFDNRGQKIARAFVDILREAGVRFGILGAAEPSTGECVRRLGNELLFQLLAETCVATLNGLGVRRIVTCGPHAYNSLRNEYPARGGRWEVVHHTQFIARLLAEGRVAVDRRFDRVLLHDPCYLGRHNGEYDAPRALLRRVSRDVPLEFPLHGREAMCCGAGGGRMWMEERIGTRINVTRVEQALPLEPAVIATAYPYCAVMIGDGLETKDAGARVATRDVAELVASALVRRQEASA